MENNPSARVRRMLPTERPSRSTTLLVAILLVGIVIAGCLLRAREPSSSPVIAAEDPYTHIVFIKEWLQTGAFADSTYLGTSMYPPGFHALSGALASDAGIDLYQWALWFPIALAAVAIVGTFVLANRLGGPAAGLAAALLVAAMPEHAFRTELFFPTALDLAVLPLFLLSFIMAFESKERGAAVMFLVVAMPLAFAHPWAVPLFLVPAFGYACLRVLRESPTATAARRSMVTPVVLASLGTAFAIASRWDHTDTGFATFLGALPGLRFLSALNMPAPVIFAVFAVLGLVGGAAAAFVVGALVAIRLRSPRVLRVGLSVVALVASLIAVVVLASTPQPDVDYVHMLGAVALMLALLGLAIAWLTPTRLGDLGLTVSVFLFPLTALNLFHSTFWPQRTVAYLCVGAALLGAAAVGYAASSAAKLVKSGRASRFVAPAAILATVLLISTAMAATPAKQYTWYRLYSDDAFATLQEISQKAAGEPGARIIVPGWQAGLFVKSLGDPAVQWYSPEFYKDGGERAKIMGQIHGPAYVIVDNYLQKAASQGKADLGFLGGAHVVSRSADGTVTVYQMES